jgi:hypothetical protein
MLDRYNIIEETETAAALRQAGVWLSAQPVKRNVLPAAVGYRSGTKRPLTTDEDWCRRWDLNPH